MRAPRCFRTQTNDHGEIVGILEIFLEYPDDFGPGREIGSVEVDLHDPANAELIKAIAYVNNKAKIAI
jgi:hypothetical protein